VKKFFVLFVLLGFLVFPFKSFADQKPPVRMGYNDGIIPCYTGYQYPNDVSIYSDVKMPMVTGKSINLYEQKNVRGKIIPISRAAKTNKLDITTLKKGTSSRTNYMYLVEVGDAGILKAAKNGNITKIHFIEMEREKLYVPMGFIPIYFDRFITTVYGE